jgi:hypothetical protein
LIKNSNKNALRSSWLSRHSSLGGTQRQNTLESHSNGPPEIAILSVNSFCQENGIIDYKNKTLKVPQDRRQLSIPNVLMSATISHEKKFYKTISIDNSQLDDLKNIPRGRLVTLFANKLQQRPIYAPFCHPVDLEGLEETAV